MDLVCEKVFCLYKVDDHILDPVICIISIGILEDAFKLEFELAEEIFKLRGDKHRNSILPLVYHGRPILGNSCNAARESGNTVVRNAWRHGRASSSREPDVYKTES
ncbi:hypothetical protein BDY21DRAFT_331166 [Lineolata rhizophorae]|uniref:Uncharacterized protein n=1 Tax=Lineolata rhizophorae TaxID=578093 RepID=A0A6A6PEG0_9PEZI|nr:hypothetical protein BDY21DRAFT_331166 [Lineolata rhizophorae]